MRSVEPKPTKINLCIDCKFFIPDNHDGKFGKCFFFPKKEAHINFLVNGIKDEEYYYCSNARLLENMCGEPGKYYKEKTDDSSP